MKLLIICGHASAQQKWIEPLRKEGWGVLCVRSPSDADQVLQFHGKSLNAIVVHREQASVTPDQAFAWIAQVKNNSQFSSVPFVVVSSAWGQKEIQAHKSSPQAVNAYLLDSSAANAVADLKSAIESLNKSELTQTQSKKISHIKSGVSPELEEVSGILSKPEMTRAHSTTSIRLGRPSVTLGGKPASEHSGVIDEPNKTMLLESTKIEFETPVETPTMVEPAAIQVQEEIKPEVQAVELAPESSLEINFNEEKSFAQEVPSLMMGNLASDGSSVVGPSSTVTYERIRPLPVSGTSSNDVDTLKNYLQMREQDVAVLTGQVRSAQERIHQLEVQLKVERARSTELQHTVQKQENTIKNYDQEKQVELDVLYKQVEDLNQRLQERTDKARIIESKLKLATEEVTKIKDRVRTDIRRIRVREKELESQLEILKKDSAALLMARDEKIVELKRKLDLMEFNMELIQEQFSKERSSTESLRQRLKEAATAMRQAGGFLETEN